MTPENVEKAFESYLYNLEEVSNLKICGLYHLLDDLNPDEFGYETNFIHVIARTKSLPHIYYYLTYDMNYSSWAAWGKIDVDTYISTPKEFDNGRFYDPHKNRSENPIRLSATRFNEAYQSWHSSMFICNGEAYDLRPLPFSRSTRDT